MNPLARVFLKRLSRRARPHLQALGLLQMSGVYQRSAIAWTPGNESVLVLAPHMDDEILGCGGTLALHRQRGARITVAFMTDGSGGDPDVAILTGEQRERRERQVVEQRKAEARAALTELGITDLVFIDARDGALRTAPHAAHRVRALIEERQPQLVYLPFFQEEHDDHRATSTVLLEAMRNSSLEFQCMGYEVWTPLFPNCLVRIDATIELKRRALERYGSQLQQADYVHACLGLNAHRSIGLLNARGGYAEAFCSLPLAVYEELYNTFCATSASAAHTAASEPSIEEGYRRPVTGDRGRQPTANS